MSLRWVDTALERPRWRATGTWRIADPVQLGLELNPAAGEVGPLATVFLLTETARRPALFLGTSSDRIGSPEGTRAYYATAAKNLDPLPASAYVTLNWSEWDEGWNVPFGAYLDLGRGFGLQPMYDGERSHLVASWQSERFSVAAMWVWLERAGVAVAYGF